MQAYHDSMMDSDSDSGMVTQFMFTDDSSYLANDMILSKFAMAKAALLDAWSPAVSLDNSYFFQSHFKFAERDLFELFGEAFSAFEKKNKSRKLIVDQTPSFSSMMLLTDKGQSSGSASIPSIIDTVSEQTVTIIGQKRKKTSATFNKTTPSCTTQVRRSARSNKYDGFKVTHISDAKCLKSKVKARKVPSVADAISKEEEEDLMLSTHAEKATPIPMLQAIGVHLCGVPAEELSPQKLLADLQEEDDTDIA
jgi:hypothetical protein